jgi:hypothetical protein
MMEEATNKAEKFRTDMTKFLEDEVQVIINKVSRAKSDSDTRFRKANEEIIDIKKRLDSQDMSF